MQHLKGGPAPFFLSTCTPRLRDDALLTHALSAFQSGHHAESLLATEYLCRRYPLKAVPAILRAKVLQSLVPELATVAWQAAWQADAENPMLQDLLLQAWLGDGLAERVATLGPAFLPARCKDGKHASLLPLLRAAGLAVTGACWKNGDAIESMVFSLVGDQRATLLLSDDTTQYQFTVPADGTRFRIPCPRPLGVWSLALVREGTAAQLIPGSPLAFYPLPALVPARQLVATQEKRRSVSIVIPVYRDFALVRSCIGSVLASLPRNRTAAKLVVIDDASPEPELSAWLNTLAAARKITLLRNARNLGFIETVNRGMRQNLGHDVLLLNADTLVNGDWIDRLAKSLYSAADVASVSPWSNNGEISSFPTIVGNAPAPNPQQLAQIDRLAAALHAAGDSANVELPSCCGFAMLIRRPVLDHIGMLDGAGMVRGYNEEVDWCMRARAAGWRHLAATGVFVAHVGTVSFGYEKTLRVAQNRAVIKARYPRYQSEFARFLQVDPLAAARTALRAAVAKNPVSNAWLQTTDKSPDPIRREELALPSPFLRVGVWQFSTNGQTAPEVLRLARLISSRPWLRLRLLIHGDVSEALWRTGVVDFIPHQGSRATSPLGDLQLLRLAGCNHILSETLSDEHGAAFFSPLTPTFDAATWLAEWSTLHGEREAALAE